MMPASAQLKARGIKLVLQMRAVDDTADPPDARSMAQHARSAMKCGQWAGRKLRTPRLCSRPLQTSLSKPKFIPSCPIAPCQSDCNCLARLRAA